MDGIDGGEHGRPGRDALLGQAEVHVVRGEQAKTAVMMGDVVPGEKDVAVGADTLDRAEPRREVRPVLQGLEFRFREGGEALGDDGGDLLARALRLAQQLPEIPRGRASSARQSGALLALMEVVDVRSDAIARGIAWLCDRQEPDGSWPQQAVNGVFFGSAMLDYRLYKSYFPTWALTAAHRPGAHRRSSDASSARASGSTLRIQYGKSVGEASCSARVSSWRASASRLRAM